MPKSIEVDQPVSRAKKVTVRKERPWWMKFIGDTGEDDDKVIPTRRQHRSNQIKSGLSKKELWEAVGFGAMTLFVSLIAAWAVNQ